MENKRNPAGTDPALTVALAAIARRAEVTGVPWRSLSRFYALPERIAGLRVLDICSGFSDLAFRLRARGAEAYALDLYYSDIGELRSRHRLNFEGIARDIFKVEPDSSQGRGLYHAYVEGFEAGLAAYPSAHLAGTATALPFAGESFDLVLSFNGLFGTLDHDADVLIAALQEGLRVLKPGGVLQAVPFQDGPVLNEVERRNQGIAVEVIASLDGVAISVDVAREEAALGGRVRRLTLTKAPVAE